MVPDDCLLITGVQRIPMVNGTVQSRHYVLVDIHVDFSVGRVGGTAGAGPRQAAHPVAPAAVLLGAHALVEEVTPCAEQHEDCHDDDQDDDKEDDDDDDACLKALVTIGDQEAGVGLTLHQAGVVPAARVAVTQGATATTDRALH